MNKLVVCVDEQDRELSIMEKMEAHEKGILHRAFSIFVFNKEGQLMLHQRALHKYHSGGLWTNTCCSHPQPGETVLESAHKRLVEEMGFDCELEEIFQFLYRAEFEDGLIEHEYDHVIVGRYDKEPKPNPEEVNAYKWIGIEELAKDIEDYPAKYTVWFKIAIEKVREYMKKNS